MHYSAGPEAEAPELRRVLDQKPPCHRRADLADLGEGGLPKHPSVPQENLPSVRRLQSMAQGSVSFREAGQETFWRKYWALINEKGYRLLGVRFIYQIAKWISTQDRFT